MLVAATELAEPAMAAILAVSALPAAVAYWASGVGVICWRGVRVIKVLARLVRTAIWSQ